MSQSQAFRYLNHIKTIMEYGTTILPRGEEVREIADLQLVVDPREPFMNFKARKYPLTYFKREMLWKLGANKYDESIKQHAKMWDSVQNPDGTFNSNYGQYWFGEQMGVMGVVFELIRDVDSRRAVIPMLSAQHTAPWVKDTVCTECIGFRLRKDDKEHLRLDMSVHMRSSDVIFGLGTDIPTFAFLYRLVTALLQPTYGNEIRWGLLTVTAMSAHIYARHFEMVDQIIKGGESEYTPIEMPPTKFMEAMYLIAKRGNMSDIPRPYFLSNWLVQGV